MKGKYVIIDLRDMECLKNENGEIDYFDTMEAARTACGMYELEGAWVMQLMYNHKEIHYIHCCTEMDKLQTILREYLSKGSEKIDVTMVLALIDHFKK